MSGSIKGMIQSICVGDVSVVSGTVVSPEPLRIRLDGEAGMLLSGGALSLPAHMRDHQVCLSIPAASLDRAPATVHGALKAGEGVYLIGYDGGKRYFVAGRR